MRAAGPAAGPPLSVSEVGAAPFDAVSSRFGFFCRLDPADPFIAREGRDVLPRRQRFGVGGQRLFQVRGQVMDHAARDRLFAHRDIAGAIGWLATGLKRLQGKNPAIGVSLNVG